MSLKVLANDGISEAGKQKLEAAGFHVDTAKREQAALAQGINEGSFDVLLVRSATKVRQDTIDACPGLKAIGRGGVGMDNIDVDYARSKGIFVFNTPASSSQAVAELAMAHLYDTARFVYDSNRQMPSGGDFKTLKKQYGKGIELRGKTLGIIGFGRIGQSLAKYALGSGMHVLACNQTPKSMELSLGIPGADARVTIDTVSKEEVLSQSDFISLHVPAQDGYVIGTTEFDHMKQGAILVNAARGGVVDEDALIAALDAGKLRHAALDVFENEPTPREDLVKHPKISVTPHIGAATVEAQDRIGIEIADILIERFK